MARTKQTARKNLGGKAPRKSHASRQAARKSTVSIQNDASDDENQIYVNYKGKEITIQNYIDIITGDYEPDNNNQNINDYIKDNADDFMESLELAQEANDFELYKKLVENNVALIDKLDRRYWPELFSSGSRKEIEFWVNYPEKSQRILDLSLIPIFYEDLFEVGLDQPNIDMDETDDAIDNLLEKVEAENQFKDGDGKKYMARIKKIKDRNISELYKKTKVQPRIDNKPKSDDVSSVQWQELNIPKKSNYDETKWDNDAKILLVKLTNMLVKTNIIKNMKLWGQNDEIVKSVLSQKPKTGDKALDLLREQVKIYLIKECQNNSIKNNNGKVIETHMMYALEDNNLLRFMYPDIESPEDRRQKLWNTYHHYTNDRADDFNAFNSKRNDI